MGILSFVDRPPNSSETLMGRLPVSTQIEIEEGRARSKLAFVQNGKTNDGADWQKFGIRSGMKKE